MPASETNEQNGRPSSNAVATPQLQTIPIDKIDHCPYQVRPNIEENTLRELADSMKQLGLLQPILVRPMGDRFEVVAGERRLHAAKLLGWTSISALVEVFTDLDAALRTLAENEQRKDATPLDRARAYQRLTKAPFNLSQEEIAKHIGLDQSEISRLLKLLDEPAEIQDLVAQEAITPHHVRALRSIEDESERTALAAKAARKGWTVRETERRAHQAMAGARSSDEAGSSAAVERAKGVTPSRSWLRHVLEILRALTLLQRLARWVVSWARRLVPGHEDERFASTTHNELPDSKRPKAA